MENRLIVEWLFDLQRVVQRKNDVIAMALQRALVPLLEYAQPLSSAKRKDLLALKGVGPKLVPFIERIVAGESVDAIAATVPAIPRRPQGLPRGSGVPDTGNWDGSWDNTIKTVEGD